MVNFLPEKASTVSSISFNWVFHSTDSSRGAPQAGTSQEQRLSRAPVAIFQSAYNHAVPGQDHVGHNYYKLSNDNLQKSKVSASKPSQDSGQKQQGKDQ